MRSWDRPLLACVLLSGALGTIHSFSLFIEPFEADLGAGRGGVASVYSVALVTLTVVVLVGHPLFRRVPGPMVALLATGGAAVGLLLAASASSLVGLLIGYGIVFGGCNGLGYAFSLQRAAEANPDRRGLALGLVTAAYALGGGGAAFLLGSRIDTSGAASAMRSLAMAIAITGLIVAALLHDFGHLLHRLSEDVAEQGIDGHHERLGEKWLEKYFGPEVSQPVRLHVAAKRYQCTVNSDYLAQLSPASVKSFILQGDKMNKDEVSAFEKNPFFKNALQLRTWDDNAKDPEMETPPLEHYLPLVKAALVSSAMNQ